MALGTLVKAAFPLSKDMALAYAYDPAFEIDPDEEKHMAKYRQCVERLDFAPMTQEGQAPTLFHFRPLTDSELTRVRQSPLCRDDLTLYRIVVRMSLIAVTNAGPGAEALEKVERKTDPEWPGFGKIVTTSYMDVLGEVPKGANRMVGELTNGFGSIVFARSTNLSPP